MQNQPSNNRHSLPVTVDTKGEHVRRTHSLPGLPPGPSSKKRLNALVLAAVITAGSALPLSGAALAADSSGASATSSGTAGASSLYTEAYRPQFHFSPEKNWMNDPNGLVYYQGEYHMFFQYNPSGDTWGNMSWGHAVSTDLVHWTQLPLAIPQDDKNMIFSGSAVIDKDNTTGFGQPGNPAMVAIYTAADKATGKQSQALAYSTDKGRTFTKYSGNPVLDIGSNNFRDPKVFWYEAGHEWLMSAALSDQHKVTFYSSPDLKTWTHLSDFGPAGATGGAWECPDLFPLPDPANPGKQKWVLTVNLNPGGIAGGSGVQYFTGSFDGTTFASDDKPYVPPAGTSLGSFDDGTFHGWQATGTAFGTAPATGNLPGQSTVTGWVGTGFANSFNGGDASTGTLSSQAFTVSKAHLNFLVGGGNHPFVADTVPFGTLPVGTVFNDFSGATYGAGWTATGSFASSGPSTESLPNQLGPKVLDTYAPEGEIGTGTITSPTFTVNSPYIDLQVAGGNHPWGQSNPTAVNLIVGGKVVATTTGSNSPDLTWTNWDVSKYQGQQAQIQVVDQNDGSTGWGHLMVGDIVFANAPAKPWDNQTSVNLVVDGQVVRSATGADSENLDWASWDLSDMIGKQAQIQVVDHSTGGWGHILADDFSLSDTAAQSAIQRAHWVDYGKDNYAGVTFNDAPGGKRIMIGWMNNWDYGGSIPTSPWRSAMTVPRELSLQTVDGAPRLVQTPVNQLNQLTTGPSVHEEKISVPAGSAVLPATGKAVDITASFAAGTASSYGLKVRTGSGQETLIGYDNKSGQVYIDRTKSGAAAFSSSFPGVQTAPLAAAGGAVKLHVLVDWSSVEVFADDGKIVLTDQIFPDPSSQGIEAFSNGGNAILTSLDVKQMKSAWPSGSTQQ